MAEEQSCDGLPPLSDRWIPPGLLAETQRVWSGHLGREVGEAEAIELLQNVRRLFELAMRSLNEADEP
jgi:hypothetical protein